MRDIAAELTRELDLIGLLTLITRRAAALLDAPIGAAMLWEETERALVPRAWHGVGPWLGDLRLRLGEGAAGRAAERRRGVVVNEYLTSREAFGPILAHVTLSAVVAVPVISLGRLVGVIAVADQRPGRVFDEHDLSLLGLLADQAAVAIEHARLFEQAASVEALRELARLKTEFLTTASHELRTPLTLIHGYAELLRFRADSLTTADVTAMAEEVLNGSRTMIRLVDDLLDFSRLESTRPILEPQRLDVTGLLDRQIQAWSSVPGGERLVLDAEPSVEAEADPARLDQIIRHLFSNALEHTTARWSSGRRANGAYPAKSAGFASRWWIKGPVSPRTSSHGSGSRSSGGSERSTRRTGQRARPGGRQAACRATRRARRPRERRRPRLGVPDLATGRHPAGTELRRQLGSWTG